MVRSHVFLILFVNNSLFPIRGVKYLFRSSLHMSQWQLQFLRRLLFFEDWLIRHQKYHVFQYKRCTFFKQFTKSSKFVFKSVVSFLRSYFQRLCKWWSCRTLYVHTIWISLRKRSLWRDFCEVSFRVHVVPYQIEIWTMTFKLTIKWEKFLFHLFSL